MNTKEIKMPNFGKAVNVDKVKDFSLEQLKALDKLLDGKATQKDYDILKGGNCLSRISTLKATLSTNGIIIDNPDSSIRVNLPNLSITKTFDCGTIFIPR